MIAIQNNNTLPLFDFTLLDNLKSFKNSLQIKFFNSYFKTVRFSLEIESKKALEILESKNPQLYKTVDFKKKYKDLEQFEVFYDVFEKLEKLKDNKRVKSTYLIVDALLDNLSKCHNYYGTIESELNRIEYLKAS